MHVRRRMRLFSMAVLSALSVTVIGAGLAWACTPDGFGTPQAPSAPSEPPPPPPPPAPSAVAPPPPATAASPAAPAASAPAGTSAGAASPSISAAPASSGADAVVRRNVGARRSATTAGSGATSRSGGSAGAGAPSNDVGQRAGGPIESSGQAAIDARVSGATAGVSRQGGRSVFSSSSAAKGSARPAAPTGSASGDLWTSVQSARTPSVAAAAGPVDGRSGELGTGVLAGVLILGLGVTGLTGAFLVTAGRRRRVTGGAGANQR